MTRLLVDTSVLLKWFHAEGEREVPEARALLSAHTSGAVDAHIIDLALYEVGNVLARSLRWSAGDVADQLDDLSAIVGPAFAMMSSWLRGAADLAERHALSFYDASWAAAAAGLGVSLVSADHQLQATGLAESPTEVTTRLRLPIG